MTPPAYWCVAPEPLTLTEALDRAALGDGAVGFLSSATEHHVVTLTGGHLHTAAGPADLDAVFAARVFTTQRELRWVHHVDGRGDAVVLSETEAAVPDWTDETCTIESTHDSGYVVWGRRFEPYGNWVRALEGRIGWLDLPVTLPHATPAGQSWPAEYVRLDYREYRTADAMGNVTVADERLTGLSLAAPSHQDTP